MTEKNRDDSAWQVTSWKGHRRAQHQAFFALAFEDKLKAVEEMADFAREMVKNRQQKGLPYIDPETGELVPGTQMRQVGESPATYPSSSKPTSNSTDRPRSQT